ILRGSPLRYTTQCPIWAHFFDFRSIEFRDGALDRLDGLVLVYRVDVHSDDLAGFYAQKVLEQLVAEVGRRDGQKAHGPMQAAYLTGAGVEGKSTRREKVRGRTARLGQLLPVETELAFAVHVEQVVHEAQPFPAVQDAGRRTKAAEVVEDIVLQMVQPGLCLPH